MTKLAKVETSETNLARHASITKKRCVYCRRYGNVKVNHKVQLKALGNEYV